MYGISEGCCRRSHQNMEEEEDTVDGLKVTMGHSHTHIRGEKYLTQNHQKQKQNKIATEKECHTTGFMKKTAA